MVALVIMRPLLMQPCTRVARARCARGVEIAHHVYRRALFIYELEQLALFIAPLSLSLSLSADFLFLSAGPLTLPAVSASLFLPVAAPGFWFGGGGHRTKFHTLIPLKSCTAMASPKFRFGGTFSKNVLIKDFWKILKFIKKLRKNLKHSQ